jgi:hypothetical protein
LHKSNREYVPALEIFDAVCVHAIRDGDHEAAFYSLAFGTCVCLHIGDARGMRIRSDAMERIVQLMQQQGTPGGGMSRAQELLRVGVLGMKSMMMLRRDEDRNSEEEGGREEEEEERLGRVADELVDACARMFGDPIPVAGDSLSLNDEAVLRNRRGVRDASAPCNKDGARDGGEAACGTSSTAGGESWYSSARTYEMHGLRRVIDSTLLALQACLLRSVPCSRAAAAPASVPGKEDRWWDRACLLRSLLDKQARLAEEISVGRPILLAAAERYAGLSRCMSECLESVRETRAAIHQDLAAGESRENAELARRSFFGDEFGDEEHKPGQEDEGLDGDEEDARSVAELLGSRMRPSGMRILTGLGARTAALSGPGMPTLTTVSLAGGEGEERPVTPPLTPTASTRAGMHLEAARERSESSTSCISLACSLGSSCDSLAAATAHEVSRCVRGHFLCTLESLLLSRIPLGSNSQQSHGIVSQLRTRLRPGLERISTAVQRSITDMEEGTAWRELCVWLHSCPRADRAADSEQSEQESEGAKCAATYVLARIGAFGEMASIEYA